jgi:hypothetical protein
VPDEDVGSIEDAGAVNVLYGTDAGLLATGNQLWHQGATAGHLAEVAAEAAVKETPAALALFTPYPNPSAGAFALAYALPASGPVRLSVFDVLGREVALLVDRELEAGQHEVTLDGSGLPPGTYLVRLEAGGEVQARPLTRVR